MAKTDFKTIDEYVATFPESTQAILEKMRDSILKAVPDAEEGISYQIPAFKINGKYFIYFSGYSKHVGLYPAPIGNTPFKKELAPYLSGKATVKFSLDKPVPFGLIESIAAFLAGKNKKRKKGALAPEDKNNNPNEL